MTKQEKYGFVYIWYDRKHKRYYIGCHWGTVDDGYICSSTWMRNSYKRRPNDFKRKIIKNKINNREQTLLEEYKWLSQIRESELGKRYYNLTNHKNGHWATDDTKSMSSVQKMANSLRKRNASMTEEERKIKFGSHHKGKKSWMSGKKHTEETKQKLREINLGKKCPNKKFKDDYTPWNKGLVGCYSEETLNKMRGNKNSLGKTISEEHKQAIGKHNSENMKRLWSDPEYRKLQLDARKKKEQK